LTVIRALRELGISNEYLVQANCGEYRPKIPNSNDKARGQNRRVEFYAVKKNGRAIEEHDGQGQGRGLISLRARYAELIFTRPVGVFRRPFFDHRAQIRFWGRHWLGFGGTDGACRQAAARAAETGGAT
jgi:hypothetical protein